jgi:signal transduction histidine kinase
VAEPRRWSRGSARSIRVRTTGLAVVVVGLAMAAGMAILVHVFRESLLGELEVSARLRAGELAVDVGGGLDLRTVHTEDLVVQLVDRDGRILASTPNAAGLPLLARPAPDDAQEVAAPVDPGTFLVVAEDVGPEDVGPDPGSPTLILGASTEGVTDTSAAILELVGVGLPIMLLVVAATTWAVVGRALAPVEQIRREVASITAAQLHRRVPDPPGDDEIGRLARTMNEMLNRLEHAQDRQRRFVADASHELRTPVASIRQHAEVALAHPERSSVRSLAETVLAEVLRMQRLVSDLLVLAASDERSALLRRRPVDLDDLVFAVAGDLRASSTLRVDTTAVSAGRVTGDGPALRRVLTNLVDNAARHTRNSVRFALTTVEDTVILIVDDDGPGIPESDRQRVLERFVRIDTARARNAGGSGLGLAIVAEIVHAHRGAIQIGESPLGGTRITVRLPSDPDSPVETGPRRPRAAAPPRSQI